MSSAVAELETALQGMLALKPPGVSGSRVTSITALCVANVQSESVLIQKIYTHFKKTPGTHKLGVLYVVDSVTRKWMDQAKQQGQVVNNAAQDGTFAAGVNRVTELMPVLMNDIISTAPGDQKEKIKKLIDIWEKGQTFPSKMLDSFKERLTAPPLNKSTTPPGSPPPNALASLTSQPAPAPAISSKIMEALANITKQNAVAAQSNPGIAPPVIASAPPPPPPAALHGMSAPPANPSIPPYLMNQTQQTLPFLTTSQPPPPQPVNAQPVPSQLLQQIQSGQLPSLGALGHGSSQASLVPGSLPFAPPPAAANADPKTQQLVPLIQALAASGMPIDQITAVVAQLTSNNAGPPAPVAPSYAPPVQSGYPPSAPPQGGWNAPRPEESRDRGYQDLRSPTRNRGRSRSRSPPRHWDSRDSPRGREDRGFGQYGRRSSPGRRDGPDYRQRSPPGRRGSSPRRENNPPRPADKWVEYDPKVANGCIKVLSRTLFVGGVTCSEAELRGIFNRFGEVQTCIVNKEKRHAFVKMFTRKDAVSARDGMEEVRAQDNALRTRWGVGYGPRDCSDYQTGVSIIPISKLTEADRKWMLTAPWGGSGGKPIETGLVVEEPDIEIGAGVSSKAISRRMQTDRGGANGPRSSKRGDEEENQIQNQNQGGGRFNRRGGRDNNRRDEDRGNNNFANGQAQAQAPLTDFPFGLTTGPNGMPIFPPNFSFPAPDGQHTRNF